MSRDIVIINVYDSPTNSSYKLNNNDDKSTLDHVSDIFTKLPTHTGYYLMGDFNARIGSIPESESPHFDPRSDHDINPFAGSLPLRCSRDAKIKTNGRPFLEFLANNDLAILNGRTLGDVFGEMTCVKYNGSSIVDYACASKTSITTSKP